MMKTFLSCLIMAVLLIVPDNFLYAQAAGPTDTVVKFFEASKHGDIQTMKQLITGPFYHSRKALLEKNKGYPNFLRDYYQAIEIQVSYAVVGNDSMVQKNHPKLYKRHYHKTKIPEGDNKITGKSITVAVVGVKLQHTDGSNFNTKLLLKKYTNDCWKIVNEILTD